MNDIFFWRVDLIKNFTFPGKAILAICHPLLNFSLLVLSIILLGKWLNKWTARHGCLLDDLGFFISILGWGGLSKQLVVLLLFYKFQVLFIKSCLALHIPRVYISNYWGQRFKFRLGTRFGFFLLEPEKESRHGIGSALLLAELA